MAQKSQQTKVKVATAEASAKTISGITAASPPVVTATSHGYANGDIVKITGVVGMVEVNDRAFVVANQTTNTFELKGVDGSGYTAYGSAGEAFKQTMTEVGSVRSVSGFDGQSSEIDVTHLRSTAKEYLVGLQDFGGVEFGIFLVTDTGQTRLRALKASAAAAVFTVELSSGAIAAFRALVRSFTFDAGGPDNAVQGSVSLRVTGEPAWFA
jgi:hypothetical protein